MNLFKVSLVSLAYRASAGSRHSAREEAGACFTLNSNFYSYDSIRFALLPKKE